MSPAHAPEDSTSYFMLSASPSSLSAPGDARDPLDPPAHSLELLPSLPKPLPLLCCLPATPSSPPLPVATAGATSSPSTRVQKLRLIYLLLSVDSRDATRLEALPPTPSSSSVRRDRRRPCALLDASSSPQTLFAASL